MKYSPSLSCARQLHLHEDISELEKAGIEILHIDIMDGNYVPNINISVETCIEIENEFPKMQLDVHLMVTNPMEYIERFSRIGTEYITFHIDSTNFAHRMIMKIKESGMKVGIAVNPGQSLLLLEPVIDLIDMVLVMSIEPGFSGQKFIETTYTRIAELNKLRRERNLSFVINVDGGINADNGKQCLKAGADILVLGVFACFKQADGIVSSMDRFNNSMKG